MEPNATKTEIKNSIDKKQKNSRSNSNCSSVRNKIVRLKCSVKNYDWGRIGAESEVARLYALNRGVEIEAEKPYAELWMGTHKNGPSYVSGLQEVVNGDEGEGEDNDGGLSLKSWIEQNPIVLGDKVLAKFGKELPFLSKVLSVGRALSIQAHPDKKLAEVLHKKQPHIYKDVSHKPEMALAVTDFEALCGFISPEELKEVFQNVPEIGEVAGRACAEKVLGISESDGAEKAKDALRSLFSEIMSASKDVISQAISRLISRLSLKNEVIGLTEKEQLALRLETQYPADVGVIAAFLLNYIKLKPGEALYLGANEPHAYIYGESFECMATSDNVVRAGLTTKNLDVQLLCSMLTYKQGFPDILQGEALDIFTTRYYPPFDEFEVDRCILPKGTETVLPAVPSPSIFLVMEGGGMMSTIASEEMIVEGNVLFTPADTEVWISTTSGLSLYRTGVNSRLV